MDYKFINNNSNTIIIIFNSNEYNKDKYEFENYFNKFFEKKKPNFLYLRDIFCSWYYYGIKGFSINFEDTIEKINKIIFNNNISKKIILGSSSGGYASLYFGIKLNADYIISFSPQVELYHSRKLYYNKFKDFKNKFDDEKKKTFDIYKLINESKNKIFIFWVKSSDFYNISQKENRYIYQNLNDEKSYNLIKNNNNIEHFFIEHTNHCDIAYKSIKSGLVDKLLNKILN